MPSLARGITKFSKAEINSLFLQARRVLKNKYCVILSAPRQLSYARILIIASKKVGNAPERNKIKRQIKSIFYEHQCFDSSLDYAIIVYKPMVTLSFDHIKQLLIPLMSPKVTK